MRPTKVERRFRVEAASRAALLCAFAAGLLALVGCAGGERVLYSLDDGVAEKTLAIDPAEATIWLNTFPVQPGGEVVERAFVAFGRPGGPSTLDAMATTVLLYEDPDGGSPQNATLLRRVDIAIEGANTTRLTGVEFEPAAVRGHVVVGVLFPNTGKVQKGVGAVDLTDPTYPGRSWSGWAVSIDPARLGDIPADQFKPLEGYGLSGNVIVRAEASADPAH